MSVIIPVRDMGSTLGRQLAALANQGFVGRWEVVVVDNGSRDDARSVAEAWRDRLPDLRIVEAPEMASSGHARNVGSDAGRGEFLLYCDADDVVAPSWMAAMAGTLARHWLATGPLDFTILNSPAVARSMNGFATRGPPVGYRFLPYAVTCNLGVRRQVFDAIGGFRPEFRSGNDVDFSWRAQLAGASLGFSEEAVVHKLAPATIKGAWHRQVRYASYAPLLYRDFRHAGMRRNSVPRAVAHWAVLAAGAPVLLPSARRYGWVMQAAHRCGRLAGSVRHRILFP